MKRDELIEALAAIEHQRWSDWQGYLQDEKCSQAQADPYMAPQPGELIIGKEDAERWARLIATSYDDLPEHSKQSDRDQVARYWPLFVEFVADWITDRPGLLPVQPESLKAQWLDEMQGTEVTNGNYGALA